MKILYILMLLPIVYSCESKKSKEYKIAYEIFESNKQKLINKYNPIDISIDSLQNKFTIKYQKLFIDSSRYLLMNGYVYDVFKIDSNRYKFIIAEESDGNSKGFISIVITNKEFYTEFHNYSINKSSNGIFIIKVNEIYNHLNPKIEEEDNDNENYSYISNENNFILLKGDIMEYSLEPDSE